MAPVRRRALGLALLAAVLAAALPFLLLLQRDDRPDIVLIVWDTCRGDRVGVNGYRYPTTPRLAELAASGVTFRQCFTPSPWTPPAHASLFTGLLPRHHGLREGVGDRVRPGIPLLAQTLAASGYETVAAVSNPHLSGVRGLLDGFGEAMLCFGDGPGSAGRAEQVRARVERWLDDRRARGARARPLFLFVNLMDSHLPYAFEAATVAAVRGEGAVDLAASAARSVTPPIANGHLYGLLRVADDLLRGMDSAYDGAVRMDDRATGSILDAARAGGLRPGALVAVVGDHGENLGEHGELSHFLSLHEPVLHVPLVISWPGRFEGGRAEGAQVRLQDLYPTILGAARVAVPGPCGKDAVSLLESPLRSRTLVAEFGPPSAALEEILREAPGVPAAALGRFQLSLLAVREPAGVPGARKYIATRRTLADGGSRLESERLYDLAADPGEEHDLLLVDPKPEDAAAAARLAEAGR